MPQRIQHLSFRTFVTSITRDETPKSREATFEVIRALELNKTWELTNLPNRKKFSWQQVHLQN